MVALLSHQCFNNFSDACAEIESRIKHDAQLFSLFESMKTSEMGRFLIENRGLNGYWTELACRFPYFSEEYKNLPEFDIELLTQYPLVLATQERFLLFKKEIACTVENEMAVLSAPAGTLPEFQNENYDNKKFSITALDIDPEIEVLLKQRVQESKLKNNYHLLLQDIFEYDAKNQFDIAIANGLNIYIDDYSKVLELYNVYIKALKPGGKLITSFLTPPPSVSNPSPWKTESLELFWLQRQKNIFIDILQSTWSHFMSEDTFTGLLKEAGFKNISITWDKCRMFPMVTAIKPA